MNNQAIQNSNRTLAHIVINMKNQIEAALPKHLSADRMLRITLTALRQNKKLMSCNPESFLGALMQACSLGLEPNTPLGQAYLIPYGNECVFQAGYKGILDLAYRTGNYTIIYAMEVYKNDTFEQSLGLHVDLKHIPASNPEGDPIAYYAVYQTKNGGSAFRVWSKEKIEKHAKKYSKSFTRKDSPWQSAFDSMAKKTVLLDLLKTAPLSSEMQEAMSTDNTIMKHNSKENSLEIISNLNYENDLQNETSQSYENNDGNDENSIKNMIVETKIKNYENLETSEDSNSKNEHIKNNKEIYDLIESYLMSELVKNNNENIKKILLELKNKKLDNNDRTIFIKSIRNAFNKDATDLEKFLSLKEDF